MHLNKPRGCLSAAVVEVVVFVQDCTKFVGLIADAGGFVDLYWKVAIIMNRHRILALVLGPPVQCSYVNKITFIDAYLLNWICEMRLDIINFLKFGRIFLLN